MAKAVLISIRPEWVKEILHGKKTLEVRKNRPCLHSMRIQGFHQWECTYSHRRRRKEAQRNEL